VGDADVAGATTTHVRGGIDIAKFLASLQKRGAKVQGLTPAQQQGVSDVVKNPTFDFYTGQKDKVLRRVTIAFSLEVPAAKRSGFGGLSSADVTLDYSIAELNQPQTITAPKVTGTSAELNKKIGTILQQLAALTSAGGLSGAGSTGTGTTGTGTSTTGTSTTGTSQLQQYQSCLTDAAGDETAVKKCLQLLQTP
jgi:hypothetical protein